MCKSVKLFKQYLNNIDLLSGECYIPSFLTSQDGRIRTGRMKRAHFFFTLAVIGISLFFLISCADSPSFAREDTLFERLEQKELTIVMTDSGLGGLSVMADTVEKLRTLNAYKSVRLVFVNALFSTEGGYNSLRTPEEKHRILDSALHRMEELYQPDLILIACNTLSILYPRTTFAQSASIPVMGIVDTGVEMMAERLKPNPEARLILFGTQTTITENTHTLKLTQMGFLPDRIITQACPDLVPYIEKDHSGDETEMLILAYVDEALQKLGGHTSPLYVCFGCTHYGYALELWQNAFSGMGVDVAGFINPNSGMTHIFDRPSVRDRFERTDIETRIISMVPIPEETVSSLGEWLFSRSPDISRALHRHEIIPDLFPWKPFVDESRKPPIPMDESLGNLFDDPFEWD